MPRVARTRQDERAYTIEEMAEISRIAVSTLYEQSRKGRLNPDFKAVRSGTQTRFPKAVIDKMFPPEEREAA